MSERLFLPWDPDDCLLHVNLTSGNGDPFLLSASYVERFWLPVLGPTCVVLLRRFGRGAHNRMCAHAQVLAAEVGLGTNAGVNGALSKSINRLVQFDVATYDGRELHVPVALPAVPEHQARRFPPALARLHAEVLESLTRA